MINIGGNIAEMVVGNISMGSAYVGSQLVWERGGPVLPYDAKVEYIQGNGSAWINPQYTTTSNSIITIDCQLSSIVAQKRIIGNITSGYFEIYINGSKKWSFASNGKTNASSIAANTSRHIFKIDNVAAKGYIDSTAVNIGRNAAAYYGTTEIFARHTVADRTCVGKIYSCTIANGTTLVRDYIPVRVGTVGCLYDKVSGALFYSSGSSDFTAGPDVT